MAAIPSYSYCSSKVRVDGSGGSSRLGGRAFLRKELSFSKSRMVFDFRVLRLASQKLRPLCPAASLSPDPEAGSETTEKGIEEAYPTKTVHVRFQLKKECQFGEQFLLVGDDPVLGSWDPSRSVPMNWSDGNLWTIDLDMPIGRQIQFKFILKGKAGIIHWQPDPDRVLKTWETDNTITVCEEWGDAALQRITEGETLTDSPTEPAEKSEMHMVADNLSPPMEKVILETVNGSALADAEEARDESSVAKMKSPPQNKSVSIVAENITRPVEKLSTETAAGVQTEETIGSEQKYGRITEKELAVPDSVPGNNLKAKAGNSASPHSEGDPITFSEGPVLVPGLMPLSMVPEKESIQQETEASIAADNTTGFKTTDPEEPEIKEKQVSDSDRLQEEETAAAQSDHEKQINEKQGEVPWSIQGQQKEVEEEEEEKVNDPAQADNLLRNDIQWGRKTLQSFLANLGLSL